MRLWRRPTTYYHSNSFGAYRILSFSSRISKSIVPVTSTNEAAFLASDDIVILASLPALDENDAGSELLHKRFEAIARRYADRYTFGLRTVPETTRPGIKCQNNVDGLAHQLPSLDNVAEVASFVKACGEPLVGELNRRTELSLLKASKSLVHYFTSSEEDREVYVAGIRTLASRYREYLNFVTVDTNEYPDMVATVGHRRGASGVLAVQNPHSWQAFPLPEGTKITADVVEQFLNDIIQEKVTPWDGTLNVGGPAGGQNSERVVEVQEDGSNAGHDEL